MMDHGLAVSGVEGIIGQAAFLNDNGVRKLNYEFNLAIELVEGGAGRWIQVADINQEGEYGGLN